MDANNATADDFVKILKDQKEKIPVHLSWGTGLNAVFGALCEKDLIQPTFVIDHPRETTPLCKDKRGDGRFVERFEPFISGWEVGNAYSELNDPFLQNERFADQVERGRGGEEETHPMDTDYVRALEYGMPPAGGVGIGIDRMIMLLTDNYSVRDVILFPLMRPE
jgi:lysyl-tRNA synthetase class 2